MYTEANSSYHVVYLLRVHRGTIKLSCDIPVTCTQRQTQVIMWYTCYEYTGANSSYHVVYLLRVHRGTIKLSCDIPVTCTQRQTQVIMWYTCYEYTGANSSYHVIYLLRVNTEAQSSYLCIKHMLCLRMCSIEHLNW